MKAITLENPTVTVIHSLPGRIRLRLSTAPKSFTIMRRSVKGHEGIISLSFNAITLSVLVMFDPEKVKEEEIILRVTLSLSRDYDLVPVRILSKPETREMSEFASLSGIMLIVSLIHKIITRTKASQNMLAWVAGFGTVGAIAEHAWSEIQKRGNFDPEVLSVVYLLTALPRGNFLPAALFTWFTTFGRHLIRPPAESLELKAVEMKSPNSDLPTYEVVVSPYKSAPDRMVLFRILPSFVLSAFTRGKAFMESDLLSQIKSLQKLHGKTLEGLGELKKGINLKIR